MQQQLLSALAGTETIEGVDSRNILFILGGAFPKIDDLKKEQSKNSVGFSITEKSKFDYKENLRDQLLLIGGEKEFIGRIEDIEEMQKLTREDLRMILMDETFGVFTKKKKIYMDSGLQLEMDDDMIEAILDLVEKESAGARAVKNIMNKIADSQFFYEMKIGGYDRMRIHTGMLNGELPIFSRGSVNYGKCNQYC